MRLLTLVTTLLIAAGMAITQHYALLNYWYWEYWWLDILMHFFGGLLIALGASLALQRWAHIILAVLVIGVLWEVFEYVIGISIREPNFVLDSSLDLFADIVGGFVACGIIHVCRRFLSPSIVARAASPDQTSS